MGYICPRLGQHFKKGLIDFFSNCIGINISVYIRDGVNMGREYEPYKSLKS